MSRPALVAREGKPSIVQQAWFEEVGEYVNYNKSITKYSWGFRKSLKQLIAR